MNLKEWLFKNKMTMTQFGRQIEFNHIYMSRVVTGRERPGKRLIKAVVTATKGEVSEEEFRTGTSYLDWNATIKPKDLGGPATKDADFTSNQKADIKE